MSEELCGNTNKSNPSSELFWTALDWIYSPRITIFWHSWKIKLHRVLQTLQEHIYYAKRLYPITYIQPSFVRNACHNDDHFKAPLRWRHNDHAGVSNHQPHDCLLNRLFRRKSKKTSKLRVTCLCVGNSPGTGEFPAQMASYAENVSIWWRHHA